MSALATVGKLAAPDRSGIRAIAVYHSQGLSSAQIELSADDLRALGRYYATAGEAAAHALDPGAPPPAQWWGNASADLGLEVGTPVTQEAMERLLQQLDPTTGAPLERASNGRPSIQAFDLSISATKDASALMLLAEEDERAAIQAAWLACVQEALEVVQREAAVVRTGKGGVVHREASGLVAVLTLHDAARPVGDEVAPHLHTHAVIMNVGRGPDGRWRTLDAARIFELQRLAGAVAGERFREKMTARFGVEWERRSADSPVFEVACFDALLRDQLSPRRRQLLEKASEAGLGDGAAALSAAQRLSREGKHACGAAAAEMEELRAELEREGVSFDAIVERSQERAQEREVAAARAIADRRWLDQAVGPVPTDRLEQRDWVTAAARLLAQRDPDRVREQALHSTPIEPDWERARAALAADRRSPDQQIADARADALRRLGRQKATFRHHEMLAAVVETGCDLATAETVVGEWIREANAVQVAGITDDLLPETFRADARSDAPLFVAEETLIAERRILKAAREGIGKVAPICRSDAEFAAVLAEMARRGKPIDPDSDQAAMLETVLRGGHQVTAVAGAAGAGKSAGMEALAIAVAAAEALPDGGHRQVFGVALAANAARNLETESGISSTSIAKLLHDLDAGTVTFEPGAIVVVDEASQASTQQLARIWDALEPVGGRLMMSGDPRQLSAVGAGGLFADLAHPELGAPECVVRLDEVRRQQDLTERAVLAFLHDNLSLSEHSLRALRRQAQAVEAERPGTVAEVERTIEDLVGRVEPDGTKAPGRGLDAVIDWHLSHGRITTGASLSELAPAIAEQWWDTWDAAPEKERTRASLLIAQTNDEARILNDAVRAEGIRRGRLDPEQAVEIGGKTWLVGERVRARQNDRSGRDELLNGMAGTVEGAEEVATSWRATVALPGGRTVERTVKRELEVGAAWAQTFSPARVGQERERAAAALAKAEEHRAHARRSDAVRRAAAAVDAARERVAWASQLPDEGGEIRAGEVLAIAEGTREEQLRLRLDDGTARWVGADYASRSLEGGAAVTAQRGQGQTVTHGIAVGAGYVALSRGREDNKIFLPLEGLEAAREEAKLEREHLDLLASHLDPERPQAVAEELASMSERLRAGEAQSLSAELGGSAVAMHADAELLRETVAREVAASWVAGLDDVDGTAERAVAVARRTEAVDELNERVTRRLLDERELFEGHRWAGQLWAPTMPVAVTTALDSKGLEANASGFVVGLDAERGLTIELGDGRQVTLTEHQVRDHLAPGWVTTVARARSGEIDADRLVVVGSGASGIEGEDLAQLREAGPLELHVTDPELSLKRAVRAMMRETITDQLTRDCAVGKSATRTIWEKAQAEDLRTAGLQGLQEARGQVTERLDAMPLLPDEDLARQRLQEALVTLRRERKALVEVGQDARRDEPAGPELTSAEPDARAQRLAELGAEIDGLTADLALVTDRQVLLDPAAEADRAVRREEVISRVRNEEDRQRTALLAEQADIDHSIDRFIAIRALEVVRMPQRPSYLPPAPELAPDGWARPGQALRSDHEQIGQIEAFRMRWGIDDPLRSLGPVPPAGTTLEREWLAVAHDLGLGEELARYEGRDAPDPEATHDAPERTEEEEEARAAISFTRTAAGGWAVRGPADLLREGEVVVTRADGTATTVSVTTLGQPFALNGERWVDATFDGPGAALELDPPEDRGSVRAESERLDRGPAEKRAFAQRLAIERARARQQGRARSRGRGIGQDFGLQIA